MKKLSCLLALLCCMMMSLSVAYASPLTGDTSNMGLWIAMVVIAVVLLVVLVIMGKKKKYKMIQTGRPYVKHKHRLYT
mgnify:CR=1 FL=1